MRHGTELRVSFAGDVSETTVFATDARTLQTNLAAADDLIGRFQASAAVYRATPAQARDGRRHHRRAGPTYWSGAQSAATIGFLTRFTHPPAATAPRTRLHPP